MIALYIVIIFIMIVLSACFSGTEAAYNSVNNMHLRREAEEGRKDTKGAENSESPKEEQGGAKGRACEGGASVAIL